MTRIWERLYIGSTSDAEELAEGNPHRIATVISLSEGAVAFRREGVNYLHPSIEDDEPVPVRQFDAIMDALTENIRWGVVLLHCGAGVSRAPSLAAAYMAAVGYKGIDAAVSEIRKVRPFIHPSKILVASMKEYLK
jgi:atypical dual specificity phosphatase